MNKFNKKIVLEDGEEYYGYGFGADIESISEIVFNTSVVGYQEIVSDPSYTYQMVVMTYPLIGNYGITDEDYETRVPTIGGLIVREYNDVPSNFRYTKTLSEYLEENNVPGIYGIDTRKLTRSIRDKGSRKVLITDAKTPLDEALDKIKKYQIPTDAVARVSCKKKWYSRTANAIYNIVAVDCGIKLNIVRSLNKRGCNVTVVPYNTPFEKIEELKPDGIFLSNGPGDPENVPEVIKLVKKAKGKYPIFGICLGHQIISLASGAKIKKMPYGHRSHNQPVFIIPEQKAFMTSQNHSYTVDVSTIAPDWNLWFENANDKGVEGIKHKTKPFMSVQFHPEASSGPNDTAWILTEFIKSL